MLFDWSVSDFSGATVASAKARPKQTDNKRMTAEFVNVVFTKAAVFSLPAGPDGFRHVFQILDVVQRKKRLFGESWVAGV